MAYFPFHRSLSSISLSSVKIIFHYKITVCFSQYNFTTILATALNLFYVTPINPFSRMYTPTKGCVIFIVGPWKEYIKKSHTVHWEEFYSILVRLSAKVKNTQGLKDESSSKQVKVSFGKNTRDGQRAFHHSVCWRRHTSMQHVLR